MDRRCHVCISLSLDKVETSFNRPFRNSTGNLGRVSNFNQSINWHRHIKDHVEIDHLTKYNLVPRSLEDEAEGEIWPNPICITWSPVRNVTGEAIISFPDLLWTKPKARSGKVRKFVFLDWLLHLTPVHSPLWRGFPRQTFFKLKF